MDKIEKFVSGKQNFYRNIIILFILICILTGGLCFQYYRRLQVTVKTESGEYLQEISKQIATNISRSINDNFSILATILTVLKNINVSTYDQLMPIVKEQQDYWNFHNVMLIGRDGTAFDAFGKSVALGSDEYLQDVVVKKKRSMSTSQMLNGKECVIFAIPVDGLTVDRREVAALAVSYEFSTFDRIISMNAFDGKGYAHIVRKDGTVVIRSSSASAGQTSYNIISALSGAQFDSGSSFEELKENIANGKNGQIGFTMDGISEYMAYTALDTEEWYLLTFVPVSVVNVKSGMLLKITVLICALITLVFALLLAVLIISFRRHKRKLEQIAYVDPVTGGNTIQRFYELASERLSSPGKPQYALVYINIEKFKVLNEQFGRNSCDDVLRGLEKGISSKLNESECIGRLFADNYCVLVEYSDEATMADRFETWYLAAALALESSGSVWLPLIVEFGVYVLENNTLPFPQMIDRAKLSLREITRKFRGKLRYAIYDEEMRRRIFREKQLEDRMEAALENGEYTVYLQPKYRTKDEQVGGAEALVRWISSSEGMIYPDEFISLFERNGFIVQLDLFVFEQVCRLIRGWLDFGMEPVKISVNCSRVHLRNPRFLDFYCEICNKYNVPRHFLEIELTESAVFENVESLILTIEEIHNAGFGCSMDDFGSGYSSLNLIQDIPVDTLKLDKIFFRNGSKAIKRTESVVASIISMSKALSMETVAEGIEDRTQVDMLKQLDCTYIQGYYFAKPMPIPEFEQLTFGKQLKSEKENDIL